MKSEACVLRGRGFTLIELLIVIMIIGILAGLIASGVSVAKRKVDEAASRAMVKALDNGCQAFENENGYFPGASLDADENVIVEVVKELRKGQLARIQESDLAVFDPTDAEGLRVRSATRAQLDDPYEDITVSDPWGMTYVARENASKARKESWMRNKEGMDIYSLGPNLQDDTRYESEKSDDIGNW